jgi:phospholipid/cholesterol/gamma-HCH transport system ATP-binding protein
MPENTASAEPVVETVGIDVLSSSHDRIHIRNVNWTVLPGEYWVVGGPNGSGKTDLLMTAAGLHLPATGTLRIFDVEILKMSEKEIVNLRKRIGFVFKGGGRMFADLTVAENVALALCYHHNWTMEQARNEVEAVLELTELTPLANSTAQTLGSDWQQRVGLARALALKPEVLFLDEPASGLEMRHRHWWQGFLNKLAAESPGQRALTIVVSTNDFTPWHGGNHRFAAIKNKRWEVLEAHVASPMIE